MPEEGAHRLLSDARYVHYFVWTSRFMNVVAHLVSHLARQREMFVLLVPRALLCVGQQFGHDYLTWLENMSRGTQSVRTTKFRPPTSWCEFDKAS